MKLIVILPAYNEAKTIGKVIERVPHGIKGIDEIKILVIDDGSTDETISTARRAGANYIYRHTKNSGVVHAFKNGLTKALELDADVIVNIDADGQFDPLEIPNLVSPILSGKADVVLGSRFIDSSHRRVPLMKRIGNLIVSLIVSLLAAKRIRDTQCGFRALSRKAALEMQLSGLFTYTQEMILTLSFKRIRITEIPISVTYFNNRKSRVVKNISMYTFKILGVLFVVTIRRFWRILLLVLFGTFILSVLPSILLLFKNTASIKL